MEAAVIGRDYRCDDCHFSNVGMDAYSDAWLKSLKIQIHHSRTKMKHNQQLDGFRAVAVTFVVFGHLAPKEEFGFLRYLSLGRLGVIAFFVLSGFLISYILLGYREQVQSGLISIKAAWWKFFVRRTLRIFPLYYGVIFVFAAFLGYAKMREQVIWHITYSSNFGQGIYGIDFGSANHFWSLCVEEQFYLFWPIIILLTPIRRQLFAISLILFLSFVCSMTWGFINPPGKFAGVITLGGPSFALAMGAWLAYNLRYNLQFHLIYWWALVIAFSFFCIVNIYGDRWAGPLELFVLDTSWSILSAMILLQLSEGRIKALSYQPMPWIGKISYGIYVYHLPLSMYFPSIFRLLTIDQNSSPITLFIIELFIILTISALSYYFFESHFLRLKDKLAGDVLSTPIPP